MEKLMVIKQAFPLQVRPYTDRNGQQQTFASRGFIVTDGIDCIYAEAIGDYARSIEHEEYQPNSLHAVQMTVLTREWKDKEGVTHYSNDVRINRIG